MCGRQQNFWGWLIGSNAGKGRDDGGVVSTVLVSCKVWACRKLLMASSQELKYKTDWAAPRQEEHGSSLFHRHSARWKTDIKLILIYKLSPQCCFIFQLFSAWIFQPMSLLPIFQYPHSMDSLFTFLISFSSMSFFLLSCPRSEGSQCHMQWIPNISSGIPLLLSFCCLVCIYFLSFFVFFFHCDSNYFKHAYILQCFESTRNQPQKSSEASSVSRHLKGLWIAQGSWGEGCWISAATTLRWHQPKSSSEEFL